MAEGNVGQCDKMALEGTNLIPAHLTILGEMSCNAPLINYTVTINEENSHTANSDSSQICQHGKELINEPNLGG